MKLTFLCSKCRNWLSKNQAEIPERCDVAYRWAAVKFEEGDLESALNSIGTVFEMSEMMLNSEHFCNSYASDWLHASSQALMKILKQMARVDDSIYIHHKTQVLLREASIKIRVNEQKTELSSVVASSNRRKTHLRMVH